MKDDKAFLEGIYQKAEAYKSGEEKPKGFTPPTVSFVKRYAGVAAAAVLVAVAAPSLYFGLNRSYPMASMASDQTMTQRIETASGDIAGSPIPPRSAAPATEQKAEDTAGAAQAYGLLGDSADGIDSIDNGTQPQASAPEAGSYAAVAAEALSLEGTIQAADVVVVATVTKIEKSVYESENEIDNRMSTTVHFKAADVLRGDIDNRFTVKVSGGFDPENSNYLPYEVIFEKDEIALLMLSAQQAEAAAAAAGDMTYTLAGSAMGKLVPVDKDTKEPSIYVDKLGNTITVVELKSML